MDEKNKHEMHCLQTEFKPQSRGLKSDYNQVIQMSEWSAQI